MNLFRRLIKPCVCGMARTDWRLCTCPRRKEWSLGYYENGKQRNRVLDGITREEDAVAIMNAQQKLLKVGKVDKWYAMMDAQKQRGAWPTLGDLFRALLTSPHVVRKDHEQQQRVINSIRLVCAWGLDLWEKAHGKGRRSRPGFVPARERIDALRLDRLTGDLVEKFYCAQLGGSISWNEEKPEHTSLNSTMRQARSLFAKRTLMLVFKDLNIPDMSGPNSFMTYPKLPQLDPEPEPFLADEFQAIAAAADACRDHPELHHRYLINVALRQTGMRSGSLLHLHKSWLQRFDDGPMLHVRTVKGGTATYSVPISDTLATLLESCDGYLVPGATALEREKRISAHTIWIKTLVRETDTLSEQGNHRLRDTVAMITYSLWGRDVAVEMLGHGDKAISRKHYARLRGNISALMKAELAHAARLVKTSDNIIPMDGKAA